MIRIPIHVYHLRRRWQRTNPARSSINDLDGEFGLYDHILPMFEKETGIKVHVVAVGTGQALRNARNGDGDVLLVHAQAAEEKFVADGYGLRRHNVMYNDFVIVGPAADPASIAGGVSAAAALARIAENRQIFASRGDNSGTHSKERALWCIARVDPTPDSGTWYRETGSGMGATLNLAAEMGAYTLTDRATWLTFGNKRNLMVLFEGDPALFPIRTRNNKSERAST